MFKFIVQFTCIVYLSALVASAESVTVRSGNGSILGRDSSISFLIGPASTDFASPFTPTDFANAQNGLGAYILLPNPAWTGGLSTDPLAKWIGASAGAATSGNTALYAVPINIANSFNNATLILHYAVDDTLEFASGSGGILLNGTAVCTNQIQTGFGQEHILACNNVGPLLHVGQNWLYFDAVNLGGAAGLLFSATISTTSDVLPPVAIPHIAVGDVWTTGFFVMNSSSQNRSFFMRFYNDSGNNVSIPFTGVLGTISLLTDTIPAQGMKYYEASTLNSGLIQGWAEVFADPFITVQAVLRKPSSHGEFFEAAVQSSAGSTEFVIPFDATTFAPLGVPLATAFAIVNLDPNNAANVVCVARNQSGTSILNAVSVPPVSPLGHWANFDFPALVGIRGTIDCTANTIVTAVAFRFIGTTVFSTLPVLTK